MKRLYNITIVTLGLICIALVKNLIRPAYTGGVESVAFVLGIAPNFLIGFIFPNLLLIFFSKYSQKKLAIISFLYILFIEIDLFLADRNFDFFDILVSIVGIFLSLYLLRKKTATTNYPTSQGHTRLKKNN